MKSTILSLTMMMIAAASLYAQDSYLGMKGGVSLPKLSGGGDNEVSRDYESRSAANFGIFVDLGVTRRLSIQPEFNFAGNGGKRKGVQPITSSIPGLPLLPPGMYFYGDFSNEAILNYLEAPVILKYRFNPTSGKRFYLSGGGYYGYLISAKTKTRGSSTIYVDRNKTPLLLPPAGQPLPPISFDADTEIKSDLNHHNTGVTGGGGIEFSHMRNYFFVEARTYYGLRSIQRDTARNGDSHGGGLIFSVGYAFRLR